VVCRPGSVGTAVGSLAYKGFFAMQTDIFSARLFATREPSSFRSYFPGPLFTIKLSSTSDCKTLLMLSR
jgi:hypothetical protein